jgi:hypothetical protein
MWHDLSTKLQGVHLLLQSIPDGSRIRPAMPRVQDDFCHTATPPSLVVRYKMVPANQFYNYYVQEKLCPTCRTFFQYKNLANRTCYVASTDKKGGVSTMPNHKNIFRNKVDFGHEEFATELYKPKGHRKFREPRSQQGQYKGHPEMSHKSARFSMASSKD